MTERFEVQRTIPFDAATIFGTLCDPQGHVAIDASGMLQSATGEPAGAEGDTFVIHMDREALGDLPMGKYDVIVTITGYEQDRYITWEVSGEGFPSIGHYYGYRLEPAEDGTLVTSIYDWSDGRREVEARRHLADHPRVGAEGHPRHPRADRPATRRRLAASPRPRP